MCVYTYIYIYIISLRGSGAPARSRRTSSVQRTTLRYALRLGLGRQYIYIYIYIYIHTSIHKTIYIYIYIYNTSSDHCTVYNFAIGFLLEIPLRDFLFKRNYMTNTEYLTTHVLFVKGFHLNRKSPQGDLKQETCRRHPVLSDLKRKSPQGDLKQETSRRHPVVSVCKCWCADLHSRPRKIHQTGRSARTNPRGN